MAMRKGLGKGLGALIGDYNEQPDAPSEGAVTLPLQKIEPIPWRIPSGCTALSSR